MIRATSDTQSTLSALFPSGAMARLVVFFLVHRGGRYHLRELQRRTRLSSASLQHELRRLTEMGVIRRSRDGRRAEFEADETHGAWGGWMRLLATAADPVDIVREALVDADLDGAFVFGSVARGDPLGDSDLDLFLVGSPEGRKHALEVLSEADVFTSRRLDVVTRDPAEITRETPFLRAVAREPKVWLRGDDQLLDPVQPCLTPDAAG